MLQPQQLTVTVNGVLTSYWQYGSSDGQPFVLVHGFRGDHHGLELIARAIVSRMSPGVRVIVPDLPGFGASQRLSQPHTLATFGSWLRAFCETVAPRGFHLVGHSFGTLIVSKALALGLQPRTLTLINPISAPALRGPRAMLTVLAIAYYRLGASLPRRFADRWLANKVIVRVMSESMAKTRDPELRAWIHAQHDEFFSTYTDRESLLEAFTASVSHTVTEFFDAFTMPTCIIAGERDDITDLVHQLRLHRLIPNSLLHIVSGVGHLVHYEAPEEAADVITTFVGKWQ